MVTAGEFAQATVDVAPNDRFEDKMRVASGVS